MHYNVCMSTTSEASGDLLTTQEVADRARVSTATVTRWAQSGRLLGVRVGPRVLRFRRGDVEAFLAPPEPAEATS